MAPHSDTDHSRAARGVRVPGIDRPAGSSPSRHVAASGILALAAAFLLLPLGAGAGNPPDPGEPGEKPGWAAVAPLLPDVDLTGHAVYLDFWASWCPPCRKSFPWMAETATRFGPAGLETIAVCLDKDPKKAEAFLAAQGEIPFRVVYDPQGEVARQFNLEGMPTSLLFAPNGSLVSRHEGFGTKDSQELRAALGRIYPDAIENGEGEK